MPEKIIHFDIETLPTDDPVIISELAKTIVPPGNIKLPESIEKWHKENGEQALKDLIAKTSFDGLYGRVACIAWAFDDGEIQSTSPSDTENQAIERFYDAIRIEARPAGTRFIFSGHNIVGFDLPFLKHRSIILGIKPPPDVIAAMKAKPWDSCIEDTILMWSTERDKRVSLHKLCQAFGIDGKDDFDGSMVAETWLNDPIKVIEYCKLDVYRQRAVHNRMMWNFSKGLKE